MKLTFTAPFLDSSGYAEFSRGFLTALYENPQPDFEFNADLLSYEQVKADHGISKILVETTRRKLKPDVNVICMIPPLFKQNRKPLKIEMEAGGQLTTSSGLEGQALDFRKSGTDGFLRSQFGNAKIEMAPGPDLNCKNIGFTMWETTRLCDAWVAQCNEMDGIIVPSTWNVEVFRKSGVTVPIAVVPPGIQVQRITPKDRQVGFSFLSIFQWTPRKNPEGLLRSYWSEFCGQDDVELVLKTYGKNRSQEATQALQREFEEIKKSILLPHYPKVRLITELVSKAEIQSLHQNSDVFVLPHRGEAWSMGHFEAMANGKAAIGTGFGGNTDFMNAGNSRLLSYSLAPVHSQNSFMPVYDGRGLWAEVDLNDLKRAMRRLYEDAPMRAELGTYARKQIEANWTPKNSAEKFVAGVREILR